MTPAQDHLDVDIVVPCYNEQDTLAENIRRLHLFLSDHLTHSWRITIANNASTDNTASIANDLASSLRGVKAVHLEQKGRGRALKAVWSASQADVLVYVDEDLSTDLAALLPLIAPLLSGHSDVAIGTRLAQTARVIRGGKREFISRTYNLMLRTTLGVGFSDAQCGFKAIRREAASHLLPLVEDDAWFFDTELLVLAERCGLRIYEVPVDWVDDVNSSVHITSTATEDIKGMIRVSRNVASGRIPVDAIYQAIGRRPFASSTPALWGQLLLFAVIGGLSTVAYAVLYWLLHPDLGSQAANLVALLITAIANTTLNRRFTFGIRGRTDVGRHQIQGLVVFGVTWAITAGSLLALHSSDPSADSATQIGVLTAANLAATGVKLLLFKTWVFSGRRREVSEAGTPDFLETPTRPLPVAATHQNH